MFGSYERIYETVKTIMENEWWKEEWFDNWSEEVKKCVCKLSYCIDMSNGEGITLYICPNLRIAERLRLSFNVSNFQMSYEERSKRFPVVTIKDILIDNKLDYLRIKRVVFYE